MTIPEAAVQEIWTMPRRQLARRLAEGHAIDPESLRGASYRGVSLGLPTVIEQLTWKVFRKEFFSDPRSGELVGQNVRLEQPERVEPIRPGGRRAVPQRRRGVPFVFGPFLVRSLTQRHGYPCREGLLLDYGARHSGFHPLGRLRDPLVAIEAGSMHLLLGASYVALGDHVLATPSYFTLEREPAPAPGGS